MSGRDWTIQLSPAIHTRANGKERRHTSAVIVLSVSLVTRDTVACKHFYTTDVDHPYERNRTLPSGVVNRVRCTV